MNSGNVQMMGAGNLLDVKTCSLLLAVIFLSACGSQVTTIKDGAPKVSKSKLMRVPDAVPKIEKVTKAGNKNPYTVFGKTYYLLSQSSGYRQTGTASWYGTKFHGRNTANGEVYDMNAMTAAHKTLPIPCYVKVRNTLNNRTVVVRVNDRGPFHGNRLIDLSYAAAVKLGFADRGTAPVEIEVIDPRRPNRNTIPIAEKSKPKAYTSSSATIQASKVALESASVASATPSSHKTGLTWVLQAGAFYAAEPANALQKRLRYITDLPIKIKTQKDLGRTIYRVQIGPQSKRAPLEKLQKEMLAVEMGKPFLVSQTQ